MEGKPPESREDRIRARADIKWKLVKMWVIHSGGNPTNENSYSSYD